MFRYMAHTTAVLLVLGLAATLTGCPETTVEVAGKATAGFPVVDAEVTVITQDSPLPNAQTTTGSEGDWGSIPLAGVSNPFRVEAQGGAVNGWPFEGALSAYVPYNDILAETFLDTAFDYQAIALTPLATCVDRYMKESGLSYPEAVKDVAAFFDLPEDVDPLDPDPHPQVFSERMLMEKAAAYGGFDAYADALMLRMGGDDTEPTRLNRENGDGYMVDMAKYSLTSLGANFVLGLAAGQIGNLVFELALAQLGIESFEDGITRNIDEIMADLEEIHTELDTLTQKSRLLLDNIRSLRDTTVKAIIKNKVRPHLTNINNEFENFTAIQTGNPASAQTFVEGISCDIYRELEQVNAFIATPGDSGLLMATATEMTNEIRDADDRADALRNTYIALEQYFVNLIATQIKGAFLEANLIHYRQLAPEKAGMHLPKAYFGTAEEFLADFQANIEVQVDNFLMAVERLVVGSADTRTIVVGPYAMFPEEAVQAVFARANFFASQYSARVQAPLVVYAVGDREMVEDVVASHMLNAAHFGMPAATPLPVNGATIREYPAPIPAHYVKRKEYFSWRPTAGGQWDFRASTTLAVARITFPEQAPPFGPEHRRKAPYAVTYKFPHGLKGTVRYMLRDHQTGLEERGDDSESWFVGDGVVFARAMPQFYGFEGNVNEESHFEGTIVKDPARALLAVKYKKLHKYRYTFVGQKGDNMNANMALTFEARNVSGASQPVKVHCKVASVMDARDNFGHAATHTHWDSAHFLNMAFDWQLYINTERKIHYSLEKGCYNGCPGTVTYDRYGATGYPAPGEPESALGEFTTHTWPVGTSLQVKHRASKNFLRSYARTTWDELDDRGSTATFSHQIKFLEFIPN